MLANWISRIPANNQPEKRNFIYNSPPSFYLLGGHQASPLGDLNYKPEVWREKGNQIMSNSDLSTSMKYEHTNLQEDLIFYKSQNFDFREKIQDLEDEMRLLKERLKKATVTEENIKENYPLGQHFPKKLLHS